MADFVLDVGALADLIAQCFQADDWTQPQIETSPFISPEESRRMNRIVQGYEFRVIAASAIAFVELARKWDEIVADRFQPHQLAAFLQDPPDWFVIEPVDEALIELLSYVPLIQELEWPDAIHVATALSREEGYLLTSDYDLRRVKDVLGGK